jgi:hypothetical protein
MREVLEKFDFDNTVSKLESDQSHTNKLESDQSHTNRSYDPDRKLDAPS